MALLQFTNLNKYGDKRTRIIYNPTTSIGFNPSGFGSFIGIRVFKYKYKHPIMSPGLVQLGGKKYIVPTWQEVLPETTLNDIEWIKPKIKKENKSKSKKWKFNSSSSDLKWPACAEAVGYSFTIRRPCILSFILLILSSNISFDKSFS